MVGVDARYHRGVRGGDRSRDHPPPDHRLHRSARLRPRNLPHGGRPPRGPMTRLLDAPERFGPLPQMGGGFIDAIEQSRLVGRGGAGFPVATKWRAVAKRSGGRAVVVVNGAEGEPRSQKDRLVMTWRPHLVLDGAFIAARVLHARRVILYIGERHEKARSAMLRALGERTEPEGALVTVAAAPARYVAGAESAAIHFLNDGVATPTTAPPLPFEQGVDRAPTLVQNVETLAQIGLLARLGQAPATTLVTLAGAVMRTGVLEVDRGTTIADAVRGAGGPTESPRAVLVGGYFGSWVEPEVAWQLPLDHETLRRHGLGLGCGVIGLLPAGACPVCETAGIMRYLAAESSAQCGPCFFGLRALADACSRISDGSSDGNDLSRLRRWVDEVPGRGACRHPDGAVLFLSSALRVFDREFANHRAHDMRRTA
ncbi:MAG: proton-conducting membrane transporter [Chloroflexi bacterium]|nr:MAG: proton-conducting membrane transporter [Chloroflexota bacterium]